MISSIVWVPAGVAAPVPQRYETSAAERELIDLLEKQGNIDQVEAELRGTGGPAKNTAKVKSTETPKSELPADLRMDEYSSDEDEDDGGVAIGQMLVGTSSEVLDDAIPDDEQDEENVDEADVDDGDDDSSDDDDEDLADVPDTREYTPIDVEGLQSMGLSQVGGSGLADIDDDDNSELDDVKLTADDALAVIVKTEDDFASLEVHVYDQKTGNLYVHHDIPLPSFPLCLAHGQVSGEGHTGNFCAVGTFSPGIEIWNLDVLNALEPSCILGGEDTSAADDILRLQILNESKRKGKAKSMTDNGLRPGSHTDAVMSLSWNPIHKQVIASGSADTTVKLWDVTKANGADCNASTFAHHKGKVQSVAFHPKEGTLLATGSYDRTVALLDARGNGSNVKTVRLTADCEAIAWDPFHAEYLTAASEDGVIQCWDVRRFESSKPLWKLVASEFGGLSDLSYNQHVPGFFATCSIDKTVTLWDAQGEKPPRSCGSKDMCAGKLYTVSFYPSTPWLLGCGGSGNQLSLWDLSCEEAIQKRFAARVNGGIGTLATPTVDEDDTKGAFGAMMTPKEGAASDTNEAGSKGNNKKKGKRKAHRKR